MADDFNKSISLLEIINGIDSESLSRIGDWKDLFLGLLDVARDLIFILNEEGFIVLINQYGAASLDYSPSELTGKHFSELIDPDYFELVNSSIALALKSSHAFFEASLLNKYEKVTKHQINIKTVKHNDKIIGLLGVGRNVTRLRKLENELNEIKPKLIEAERLITLERTRSSNHKMMLDELNRMKGEFVSNISHELRTPLASIVGFSETIASDPNMPAEMRQEFNLIILNEGKRLAKLINDVLDLSRMETGRIALNKSRVNLCKIILDVINSRKKDAEEKNLFISSDIPSDEIIIEADQERLAQAIDALMDNAIKFTNDGGRIKVIINNLFREVELIISDTGIGIADKDLPYLFQKFYRVNRHDSEIGGAGMGLVFVKQIVDLHKGLINIQSELNKGTSVLIKLLKNNRE
ncbi:MAG TPA: ATP-binding protein [Ignavibacteriaceae bacterium]|nr:ATP-binding protein [Ignavibacteriaceae bacterium]